MAIQTFTSGQVLTATQVNNLQANDYNLTVNTSTGNYTLVVGDRGTRRVANSASAIAFTVNASVFSAGDIVEIHNIGAGTLTITAGTATVTSADVLTVAQWQGGTLYFTSASAAIWFPAAKTVSSGGLVLISSTTIGSSVTSVSLTNVFSSTYDNYRILINGGAASTTSDGSFYLGSDNVSGYYNAFIYNGWPSQATAQASTSNVGNSSTTWAYSANGYNLDLTLFGPNLAARTSYVFMSSTMATTGNRWAGGGYLNNATQYTGMTFQTQSGHTLTGGTIRVYGYRNTV